MDYESIIVGVVLITAGTLNVVNPMVLLRLRIWMAKTIYGAEFKPSERTIKIHRFLGVVYIGLGIFVITNTT